MKPEDKKRLEEIRFGGFGRLIEDQSDVLDFLLRLFDESVAQLNDRNEQLTNADEENRKLLLIAREYLEGK